MTTRITAARDRRPPGEGISNETRWFVAVMRRAGFEFTLENDGKAVRVQPHGRPVHDSQRIALRGVACEIRDLLIEEEKPQ